MNETNTSAFRPNYRYLRYAILFFCCFFLLNFTDERDAAANDPEVREHNQRVQKFNRLLDSVQRLPPLEAENVDPSRPVYLKGEIRNKNTELTIDDPFFGVSFGDCIGVTRYLACVSEKPEKLPEGLPEPLARVLKEGTVLQTILPINGLELLGFDCPPELTLQLITNPMSGGSFGSPRGHYDFTEPSLHFERSELSKIGLPIEKTWEKTSLGGKNDDALFVSVGTNPKVDFKVVYVWQYPAKVNYIGGVQDGKLSPLLRAGKDDTDSPSKTDSLYLLDSAPIDIKERMQIFQEGGYYFDPLGEQVVEMPPSPIPYARSVAKFGSIALGLLSMGLLLFVQRKEEEPEGELPQKPDLAGTERE